MRDSSEMLETPMDEITAHNGNGVYMTTELLSEDSEDRVVIETVYAYSSRLKRPRAIFLETVREACGVDSFYAMKPADLDGISNEEDMCHLVSDESLFDVIANNAVILE